MPVWYEIAGNAHARKSSNATRPWLSVRERASGRWKDAHGVVDGDVAPFSLGLDLARQVLRTCHQVRSRA